MKYKIEIPTPCHEDWSQMTPAEKGKFCQNCQKVVVDFTKKNDREVLEEINEDENLCGRFRKDQLNRKLNSNVRNNISKVAASIALTAMLANSEPVFAQGQPMKVKKADLKEVTVPKGKVIIKGKIVDEEGGLPGVSIKIKGTKFGTDTDFDGNFSITLDKTRKSHETLVFEYLGYKKIEWQIVPYQNIKEVKIVMKEDKDHKLEEIAVGRIK